MKMMPTPELARLRSRTKRSASLFRRQHRGWFIQDENARAPVKCLGNLDALTLPHRQIRDERIWLDPEIEPLGGFFEVSDRSSPAREA